MQSENIYGLSRKSRGILFTLKNQLNRQKKTLKDHICQIFNFEKNEYNKKQFISVIRKYDSKLLLTELDQLFDELDDNRNQKIFFYKLKQVYQSINESDNPKLINQNSIIRTAGKSSRHRISDIIPVYTQIRTLLLTSEDIIEMINILAQQNEGFLTVRNINDLLNNLDYHNESYRGIFLQSLMEGRQKIAIETFLEKLDMLDTARRSSLRQIQSQQKIPAFEDVNQSKYIRNVIKDQRMQDSVNISMIKSLNSRDSNQSSEYIKLEDIPEPLRPYFNYGSELQHNFSLIARDYIESSLMFIDTDNPPYSQAYEWVHLAENTGNYFLFQMAQSVLVRERNRKGLGQLLQPKDIIQGNLGDCYFLSAVAGVVQKYPQLLYRLFVLQKNPSHIYGVRLFIEGMWKTIILDACFPVHRNGAFCAAQPHHQQIWVMLLQKAWAKVYGSYDNIHSGYNQEGLNAISGAPSIFVSARETEFVRRVEVQIKRGSIITCATSSQVSQLSKAEQQKIGMFSNHAYSLLNIISGLRGKDGKDVILFKVRNPWGRKEWQGKWSFRSQLWTQQLRAMMDYRSNPKDGTFLMCLQDFSHYFDHINICRVNLSHSNSWIQVQADRQQFKAISIKVRQRGDYYFTIYQQNPRRYSGRRYEKSKSWMFLMEDRGGKYQAIGSCCKDKKDNTIEVSLQKGQYILVAKVQWKQWQKHKYCLSSYGPQKVNMNMLPQFNIHLLSDFIQSKAKLGFGKKSFYDNANILKRLQFSPEQGYGFILINNQQNKIFDIMIKFDTYRGLTILPPYSLPIHLQIFPGEQIICKFLVDPTGYSYSLKQAYNYLNSV